MFRQNAIRISSIGPLLFQPHSRLLLLTWLTLLAPFIARANEADSVVTFNEIHYHPKRSAEAEWIEIHNQMSVRVDLSKWSISGGIEYAFPEASIMEPGAYWTISSTSSLANETYHHYGPFEGKLSNDGERLILKDRNGRTMDFLEFSDDNPWPQSPDGTGATLAKINPNTESKRADNWTSSEFEGGTPGQINFLHQLNRSTLNINEVAGILEENFWVELKNVSSDSLNLNGFLLGERQLPDMDLAPNERFLVTSSNFGYTPESNQLLVLKNNEGAIIQAIKIKDKPIAFDPLNKAWQYPAEPTPNTSNSFNRRTEIVINEILYHNRPTYSDPINDVAYSETALEWIELHNRSNQTVDLSGWRLQNAIEFAFPEGTQLPPNAFLVLDDSNFSGGLSNENDRIELLDSVSNIVDVVEYYDDHPWPQAADGRGSSLELVHPFADNNNSASWAASDESDKSEWQIISYRGIAASPPGSNNPKAFNEFLMGMLDSGEILIDDISVVEDPDGENIQLIQNGDFEQDTIGATPSKWRILGSHKDSHVTELKDGGKALLVVATGAADHSYNLASTTFAENRAINPSKTYEISFRAKWLSSSPQLNTRLYFNRLARTHILPQPVFAGTPGEANSTLVSIPPPSIAEVRHSPLVPGEDEPVLITTKIDAAESSTSAIVHYNQGDDWQQVTMSNNAHNGYQATLPGLPDGSIVQFYIEAKTEAGGVATYPKHGTQSPALYRVGDRINFNHQGHSLRVIMDPEVVDFMHSPLHTVSDYRYQATVIYNNSEIWYDALTRLRGSPQGRNGARRGWNIKFPADRKFRGAHETISVDGGFAIPKGNGSDVLLAGAGVSTNELIYNQMAHRAGGIPSTYDDIAFIEAPQASDDKLAQLKLARFGKIWKESNYQDGNDGTSFKFELIYHPVTTDDGEPESLKTNFTNVKHVFIRDMGEDKEAYRYNFEIQNNKDQDNYNAIMEAGKALVDTQNLKAATDQALDIDNWLRVMAFQALTSTIDSYNVLGFPHNMLLYRPPYSSQTMWIPWDVDRTFFMQPSWSIFAKGNADFAAVVQIPENRRRYAQHLLDLCYTGFNPSYITDWVNHYNNVGDQPLASHYSQWIKDRRDYVLQELEKQYPPQPFSILSNDGNNFTTNQSTVDILGSAWIDLEKIRIAETGQALDFHWSDSGEWEATVQLNIGQNELTLVAFNSIGEQLDSDYIKIANVSSTENASAQNLIISELMYHPSEPNEAEISAGFDDDSFFEYVELLNIGPHPIDLSNLHFTNGIDFDFSTSSLTNLMQGQTLLIALNKSAFELRYGDQHAPIGELSNDTKLSNGGESIRIENQYGEIVVSFEYNDKSPWPEEADGDGYSLELIDPFTNPNLSKPSSWKRSVLKNGTPGFINQIVFQGDPFGDDDQDGYSDYLNFLFGGSGPDYAPKITLENGVLILSHYRNLRIPTANLDVFTSNDLENWIPVNLELINEKTAVNGTSLLRWRIDDTSDAKFIQIRASIP